jgi:hypothetical protein
MRRIECPNKKFPKMAEETRCSSKHSLSHDYVHRHIRILSKLKTNVIGVHCIGQIGFRVKSGFSIKMTKKQFFFAVAVVLIVTTAGLQGSNIVKPIQALAEACKKIKEDDFVRSNIWASSNSI